MTESCSNHVREKSRDTEHSPPIKRKSVKSPKDVTPINMEEKMSKKELKRKRREERLSVSEDPQTAVSEVSKKKKAKKKKSSTVVQVEDIDDDVQIDIDDQEDVPESIDSGCVVDGGLYSPTSAEMDWDEFRNTLVAENSFINNLIAYVPRPHDSTVDDIIKNDMSKERKITESGRKRKAEDISFHDKFAKKQKLDGTEASEAEEEFRQRWTERLSKLQDQRRKKGDKAAVKKIKKEEKKIYSKLKQLKNRQQNRNPKLKKELNQLKKEKTLETNKNETKKSLIKNSSGQLVFSKFDFTMPTASHQEPAKKAGLHQLLSKALKEKEKLRTLEEKGRVGDAVQIREKSAWEGALKRAEGGKVMDNAELLKKSVDKLKAKKKLSKKKWDSRAHLVNKQKEDKQVKRKENLQKRKDRKNDKKKKKLMKKGHIVPVPGF